MQVAACGARLVLGAEALEHGHERAEVLQAGDGDAHRRHHLAAEEVVVILEELVRLGEEAVAVVL